MASGRWSISSRCDPPFRGGVRRNLTLDTIVSCMAFQPDRTGRERLTGLPQHGGVLRSIAPRDLPRSASLDAPRAHPAFLETMKQAVTPIRLSEGEKRQVLVPLTPR